MSSPKSYEAYRFVVVYRRERREIPGADSQWRGWVLPVHDSGGAPRDESRLGFSDLDELPNIFRRCLREQRDESGETGEYHAEV